MRKTTPTDVRNALVLLYVLGLRERGGFGRTELQKLLFKAELELRDKLATPSYPFIRYNHGPFCGQVFEDAERLEGAGLAVVERERDVLGEKTTKITQQGRSLRSKLLARLEAVTAWPTVKRAIDDAASFVAARTASELEDWSHELELVPDGGTQKERIHDMRRSQLILEPTYWDVDELDVPEDILVDLDYALQLDEAAIAEMGKLTGSYHALRSRVGLQ